MNLEQCKLVQKSSIMVLNNLTCTHTSKTFFATDNLPELLQIFIPELLQIFIQGLLPQSYFHDCTGEIF